MGDEVRCDLNHSYIPINLITNVGSLHDPCGPHRHPGDAGSHRTSAAHPRQAEAALDLLPLHLAVHQNRLLRCRVLRASPL
jgi:hypothetical protein